MGSSILIAFLSLIILTLIVRCFGLKWERDRAFQIAKGLTEVIAIVKKYQGTITPQQIDDLVKKVTQNP